MQKQGDLLFSSHFKHFDQIGFFSLDEALEKNNISLDQKPLLKFATKNSNEVKQEGNNGFASSYIYEGRQYFKDKRFYEGKVSSETAFSWDRKEDLKRL